VYATVSGITSGGIVARYADSSNFLMAQVQAGSLILWRRVAGTFTQIGSTYTGTISNSDVIKLTCNSANDLAVYQNGTSRVTGNHSAGSSNTKHGLVTYSGITFDDFTVTDTASGSVSLVPDVGALTTTGYAPTAAQTANQSIAPGVGELTVTAYAPSVAQPIDIAPDVGQVLLTAYAPTVSQPIQVSPAWAELVTSGYAPTVTQAAGLQINPDPATATLAGYAPVLSQSANQSVLPGAGSLTTSGYAPTIGQATASPNIEPGPAQIIITGYSPAIVIGGPRTAKGERYFARVPPSDPAQLPAFLAQELRNIERAMQAPVPWLTLQTQHREPEKLFEGMVVRADGVQWNPGGGPGRYERRDGAWEKF
jgi:hypothetical protein